MHEVDTPEAMFRRRVRELRQERGWSQAELAKRLANHPGVDLDQSKIARIEADKRTLSLAEAVALARVLDSSVDLMVLQRVSLEDQIADAQRRIEELAVIAANTGVELQQAQDRLERLEASRASARGGDRDGEHQAPA